MDQGWAPRTGCPVASEDGSQPHTLPAQYLEGDTHSMCNPCGPASGSPRAEVPVPMPCLMGSPAGPPSLPAPQGRTLLEAKMGHPLDGRVSLLHELVEADQEGLFLLPLPACLREVLRKEQDALGAAPSCWVAGGRQSHWLERYETCGLELLAPTGESRPPAPSLLLWPRVIVLASERHICHLLVPRTQVRVHRGLAPGTATGASQRLPQASLSRHTSLLYLVLYLLYLHLNSPTRL